MTSRLAYLYIAIIFFLTGWYLFQQGSTYGVCKYKHSKNMEFALKSAYRFGYEDATAKRPEDWDDGGE